MDTEYRNGSCHATDKHGCGVTQFAPSTDALFSQSFGGIVCVAACGSGRRFLLCDAGVHISVARLCGSLLAVHNEQDNHRNEREHKEDKQYHQLKPAILHLLLQLQILGPELVDLRLQVLNLP